MTFVQQARAFAIHHHAGQKYGADKPYVYHLDKVVAVLFNDGEERENVLVAAYLHDVVEDTACTVEDVAEAFGPDVADLVARLTMPKGKRADAKEAYLTRIREVPDAAKIKLADRIANVEECKATDHSLIRRYRKEQFQFESLLRRPGEFEVMWERLDKALGREVETPGASVQRFSPEFLAALAEPEET